ncbi:hypothetical protein Golob_018074 [Gossypium lobatum]|uniref:Zinc knuckle CX2CX4HX4C domain-containing protein n=1 Tax=Gossypium lobatum TaxID=34289 RepID=A0A7J8M952_9ROSI|nr:hypothetical protein [Gossypium lobatum]
MDDEMANLCLADEEEDAFQENPETTALDLQFCLVEACLMNSVIPTLGIQRYMRIRVRLDVSLALKRKKKGSVGRKMYYARFQYEKLILFCFICGKLGHEESFCSIRARIDLEKIVFEWDITLRTSTRERSAKIS